ncbi:MAG: MauE/DoxX family redox-associated membrane protein [Verrucomicrobiota bacterium]
MKVLLSNPIVLWCIRLLIGGVFIYAGFLKVLAPLEFADNIEQYKILPLFLVNVTALTLPIFECIVGTLLVSGRYDRLASSAVVLMSSLFAVALVSVIVRGLVIDCGCFGTSEASPMSAWYALGRNILILSGALILYTKALHFD